MHWTLKNQYFMVYFPWWVWVISRGHNNKQHFHKYLESMIIVNNFFLTMIISFIICIITYEIYLLIRIKWRQRKTVYDERKWTRIQYRKLKLVRWCHARKHRQEGVNSSHIASYYPTFDASTIQTRASIGTACQHMLLNNDTSSSDRVSLRHIKWLTTC